MVHRIRRLMAEARSPSGAEQAGGARLRAAASWPLSGIALDVVAFAVLLALAVGTQLWVGAYRSEFQGDATGHYVSGLVIHDYIKTLLSFDIPSPIRYVAWFHGHYPLVGIGHWPPAYYLAEAAWMLGFSASLVSLLALSATVTACTAWLVWFCLRREFGTTVGCIAAGIFVVTPVVMRGTSELMLDVPVALLCLAAAIAFARYLATARPRWSAGFGCLAAVAMLTKGNSAALALLPPFAVLYSRRLDLLRRASFWLPLPIVAVLAGPWLVLTFGQVEPGFRYHWGLGYAATALAANATVVLMSTGPVVMAAAMIGLVALIARNTERSPLAVSMAALLSAVWIFQSVVPAAIEARYLIPLIPPLVILAVHGTAFVVRAIRAPAVGRPVWLPVAAVFATVLPFAARTPMVTGAVFATPAEAIWQARVPANPVVLLAVNGNDEGAVVAELAMRDPARPSLFAIRGSRLLGGGGFNNQDYLPLYHDPDGVAEAIDRYAIPFVLFSTRHDPDEWQHIRQIEVLAARRPERWKQVRTWNAGGATIILYRIVGNDVRPADTAALLALSGPRALAAGH